MVIKKIFRIISIVSFVLTILGAVFIYFLFTDAMEFKDNFSKGQKLFLLKGDSEFLTGFSAGDMTKEGSISYLSEAELNVIQNKAIESISKDTWKLFVIDMDAFDGVNELLVNEEIRITKQDMENILKNDDFASLQGARFEDEEVKAGVFALMISEAFRSDPIFLLKEYKEGNIGVFPETMLFNTVKMVPTSLFESLLKKAMGGIEDKLKEVQ